MVFNSKGFSKIVFTGLLSLEISAQAQTPKPNVVLILVDDLGWSDFGCYGSEIRTPTIDSLATNGIRYRQFYNAARCSPTRCSILTGLYTHQVAVDPAASLPNLRTDNNVTIAELLGQNGYRTYMSGKWHLGPLSSQRDPISRGFQHAFGMGKNVDGSNVASYWNISLYGLKSTNNEIPWNPYSGQQFYQTDAIGDYGVTFIRNSVSKNDGKPFFLYLAFNASHWPIQSPVEVVNKYTDIGDPNPSDTDIYRYEVGWDSTRMNRFLRQKELGVTNENYLLSPRSDAIEPTNTPIPEWSSVDAIRRNDLARRMAVYAGMIHQLDVNIKKVVDELKASNQLDNTLFFIIADNGGNYEGGLYGNPDARSASDLATMGQSNDPSSFPRVNLGGGWANVNNTPFRMYKHFVHEGGIRSPGIIFYPAGVKKPGTWVDQPCHLIDVMATVVGVTGVTYPTTYKSHPVLPLEGKSLVPHFVGGKIDDRQIFEEHEGNRALFDGDYKFVTKNVASSDGSTVAHQFELYNLKNDPSELTNLATLEPVRLISMVKAWNKKAAELGVPSERFIQLDTVQTGLGLKFHFTFDDKIIDESPSKYVLSPIVGYSPIYGDGKFGKAIELNGTTNYLDLIQEGILNPAQSSFTVCAWVYNTLTNSNIPSTGSIEQQVLHQLTGRIMLGGLLSATESTLDSWQGGVLCQSNPNTFSRNEWQHVAVVSNPTTRTNTFYVNGSYAGSVTTTGSFESCTSGFRIGAHKTGNKSFWSGKIDELYLFEGELDLVQIKNVMNTNAIATSFKKANNDNELEIHPNPVSDFIYFAQEVSDISIINTLGIVVMNSAKACKMFNIELLVSGQYIIRAKRGRKSVTSRFVKN